MQVGNWKMKLRPTKRGSKGFTLTELLAVICALAVVVAMILPRLVRTRRGPGEPSCVFNLKQIGVAFRIWEGDNNDKYPMQVSVTNGGAMELAVDGDVSAIFRVMSNELSMPKVLICPEDTGRHFATNFTTDLNHQTISYFVGLDAEDKYPQMILSGDDNLEVNGVRVRPGILNLATNASVEWTENERHGGPQQWNIHKQHRRIGNILFADGSVLIGGSMQYPPPPFQGLQQALVNTHNATNRLVIP